tara:strand:+ start:165 stop:413 length:249 start_codon:yes stop_codon:yes gene_type:complete
MYYKKGHKMYARHCAIDLLKIHKSYGKAMVLAQEGLRWANDYNEECYWNRVIRELNLYESYIDDFRRFGIYYVYTKGGRNKQ